MFLRSLFFALVALYVLGAHLAAGDDTAAAPTSSDPAPRKTGGLVIEVSGIDDLAKRQLHGDASRLVELCCNLGDFHCCISPELLQGALGSAIAFDAPFKDVLLDLPVTGDVRFAGQVRITLVPDEEQIAFELCTTGEIQMRGIGRARGVRIHYDGTSRYRATKRIMFASAGLSSLPATCAAESSVTVADVSTGRPGIVGRFVERAARRQAVVNQEEAEAECSEHVEAAIRRALDCEVATLAKIVNTAMSERMQVLRAPERHAWQDIKFHTEDGSIHIARHDERSALAQQPSASRKQIPPASLRVFRSGLDFRSLCVLGRIMVTPKESERQDVGRSQSIFGRTHALTLQPALAVEPDTLTIVFDFPQQAQIARALTGTR
ncbi:MAG: hypothetical protein HYX69_16650 [Planctomycetia bacterium]|nr:hypothetical protein [Planctomycetia bacterium]